MCCHAAAFVYVREGDDQEYFPHALKILQHLAGEDGKK